MIITPSCRRPARHRSSRPPRHRTRIRSLCPRRQPEPEPEPRQEQEPGPGLTSTAVRSGEPTPAPAQSPVLLITSLILPLLPICNFNTLLIYPPTTPCTHTATHTHTHTPTSADRARVVTTATCTGTVKAAVLMVVAVVVVCHEDARVLLGRRTTCLDGMTIAEGCLDGVGPRGIFRRLMSVLSLHSLLHSFYSSALSFGTIFPPPTSSFSFSLLLSFFAVSFLPSLSISHPLPFPCTLFFSLSSSSSFPPFTPFLPLLLLLLRSHTR